MAEQISWQMSIDDFFPEPEPQKEEFDILNHIPVGSKNAIKRKWLCFITGLIDRTMRNLLHEARKKIPIINLQNGKGYFIPDMNIDTDKRLLIRWVKQEESRIKESQLCVDCAIRTLDNCCIDWRNEEDGGKTDVLENDSGFRCVS